MQYFFNLDLILALIKKHSIRKQNPAAIDRARGQMNFLCTCGTCAASELLVHNSDRLYPSHGTLHEKLKTTWASCTQTMQALNLKTTSFLIMRDV